MFEIIDLSVPLTDPRLQSHVQTSDLNVMHTARAKDPPMAKATQYEPPCKAPPNHPPPGTGTKALGINPSKSKLHLHRHRTPQPNQDA